MFKKLPEEIINNIYKIYFTKYVLSEIKPKCNYNFKLGTFKKGIKCNLDTMDSAFCLFCHYNFTNMNYF